MLQRIEYPSPNWNERPSGSIIDTVIIHYTGMETGAAALERLCDTDAEVSAHYLIEEDGRLFQMVHEDKRAWHAGISCWQGRENMNHTSIGIELVNPGHEFGYRSFPQAQIETLLLLLGEIRARHSIPAARYLGHSDIAPTRKADPGELFPWRELASHGFGIYPEKDGSDQTLLLGKGIISNIGIKLNKQLGIVGYDGCNHNQIGDETEKVLSAFQAHWRPEAVTGKFDKGTALVLEEIAGKILLGDTE